MGNPIHKFAGISENLEPQLWKLRDKFKDYKDNPKAQIPSNSIPHYLLN